MSIKTSAFLGFIVFFSVFVLSGCQSTKPGWYTSPQVNDDQYLYAVAQARNLSQAKKMAVSNINENLWTQVKSSSYIRDTLRETNASSFSNSLFDNKVNTKTETLTLNGIEFVQMEENDLGAFVEVRVKKSLVAQQLKSELQALNQKAKSELSSLVNQDKLLWWLDNRTAHQIKHDASVRVSMLMSLDPSYKFDTQLLNRYIEVYQRVGDKLYIRISYDSNSNQTAQFLSQRLSEFNIATTSSKRRNQTHTLRVISEKRRHKVAGAYITTLVSKIKVSNMLNKTISSSEVISTGNSVISYKYADEGAARNFDQQIKEQGIWAALGLLNLHPIPNKD